MTMGVESQDSMKNMVNWGEKEVTYMDFEISKSYDSSNSNEGAEIFTRWIRIT